MSAPDPRVIRHRGIRERILRLLDAQWRGNPDGAVPYTQIVQGFATGRVSYSPSEIQGAVLDLGDDRLIDEAPDDLGAADGLEKAFRVTSRGRDFVRARMPWGRIDEYTGS